MEIAIGRIEKEICERLNILSTIIDGGNIGHNCGAHFDNDIFEMNDYYWGDCTCGYADLEEDWISCNFHREYCYQTEYEELTRLYPDKSFLPERVMKKLCKKHDIPYNNGISSAVHCSCDFNEKWVNFISVYDHKNDCLLIRPNFKYFDFEISWYKYLGRDMKYSRELSRKEINEMFDHCEESLKYVKCRT
jgi:hypothetical protein